MTIPILDNKTRNSSVIKMNRTIKIQFLVGRFRMVPFDVAQVKFSLY